MNKLKMLAVGMLAMLSFGFASAPVMVSAVSCPSGSVNGSAPTLAECNLETGGTPLMTTIQIIINVVLSIIGIVAVAMIIVGGFQYTTASGDPAKATKAKNTIMYAVIGLVIALLAFAIVNFVLGSVFGAGSGGATPAQTPNPTPTQTQTPTP